MSYGSINQLHFFFSIQLILRVSSSSFIIFLLHKKILIHHTSLCIMSVSQSESSRIIILDSINSVHQQHQPPSSTKRNSFTSTRSRRLSRRSTKKLLADDQENSDLSAETNWVERYFVSEYSIHAVQSIHTVLRSFSFFFICTDILVKQSKRKDHTFGHKF